jgi:hypothetical protein
VGLGGFVGSLLGVASGEQRQRFQALALAAAGFGLAILLLTGSRMIHWASLSAFLAGACSVFTINLDTALLQGMTALDMQGRVSSISSLGKGLQSISAAAASEVIAQLNTTALRSNSFVIVQSALAVALVLCTLRLWMPLNTLAEGQEP